MEALPRSRREAHTIALVLDQDADLLEAAAVLHDICYAPDLAKTGFHPLDGARYLRDVAGADNRLEAAAKRPTFMRWVVGVGMGFRQGEALGFRWKYVDLDNELFHPQ